jgi:hypothetical protein
MTESELAVAAPEELALSLSGLDVSGLIGNAESVIGLLSTVLGLVAKVPGPQQAAAADAVKVLQGLETILGKL